MQNSDLRDNKFQLPGQTGSDEPAIQNVENQFNDAQTPTSATEAWPGGSNEAMAHNSNNILIEQPYDPSYIAAMAADGINHIHESGQIDVAKEIHAAGEDVERRAREGDYNEHYNTQQYRAEEQATFTEANVAIKNTKKIIVENLRVMYRTDDGQIVK